MSLVTLFRAAALASYTADEQAIAKEIIGGDPANDTIGPALAPLQASGVLKELLDERKRQAAINDPKTYLTKYNEAKNKNDAEAASQAKAFREKIIKEGVGGSELDAITKAYFENVRAAKDIELRVSFPSAQYREVLDLVEKHRTIAL